MITRVRVRGLDEIVDSDVREVMLKTGLFLELAGFKSRTALLPEFLAPDVPKEVYFDHPSGVCVSVRSEYEFDGVYVCLTDEDRVEESPAFSVHKRLLENYRGKCSVYGPGSWKLRQQVC